MENFNLQSEILKNTQPAKKPSKQNPQQPQTKTPKSLNNFYETKIFQLKQNASLEMVSVDYI